MALLFVGAGLLLRDGKSFFEEESLQSTFKSNKSVTIASVKWSSCLFVIFYVYKCDVFVTADCLLGD